MTTRVNSTKRYGGAQYGLGPAERQRRLQDERDIYHRRLEIAEQQIAELKAQLTQQKGVVA